MIDYSAEILKRYSSEFGAFLQVGSVDYINSNLILDKYATLGDITRGFNFS